MIMMGTLTSPPLRCIRRADGMDEQGGTEEQRERKYGCRWSLVQTAAISSERALPSLFAPFLPVHLRLRATMLRYCSTALMSSGVPSCPSGPSEMTSMPSVLMVPGQRRM